MFFDTVVMSELRINLTSSAGERVPVESLSKDWKKDDEDSVDRRPSEIVG